MKIAIAFGWGRESAIMLKHLIRKKPILICCLGEEDDIDDEVARMFADSLGLDIIIIYESFSDYFEWNEMSNMDLECTLYENTILKFFQNKEKPFDVLYVGRRKNDVEERTGLKGLPDKAPKIKGVEFPLWRN